MSKQGGQLMKVRESGVKSRVENWLQIERKSGDRKEKRESEKRDKVE